MYYLLEDNIIIDSEKLSVKVIEYQGKQYLSRDSKNIYSLGTIKKQSENVYDLIEVGDLVGSDFDISRVVGLQSDSVVVKHDCCIYFENITTIYKPDAKGNYIKAWEKKDE